MVLDQLTIHKLSFYAKVMSQAVKIKASEK